MTAFNAPLSEPRHITIGFTDAVPNANALYYPLYTLKNIDAYPFPVRVHLAHLLLHALDMDWPYVASARSSPSRAAASPTDILDSPEICEDCGGLVYPSPLLTPTLISDVAALLNLRLSLCIYCTAQHCKEAVEELTSYTTRTFSTYQELVNLRAGHLIPFADYSTTESFMELQNCISKIPPILSLVHKTYAPTTLWWREPFGHTVIIDSIDAPCPTRPQSAPAPSQEVNH